MLIYQRVYIYILIVTDRIDPPLFFRLEALFVDTFPNSSSAQLTAQSWKPWQKATMRWLNVGPTVFAKED